MKHEILQQIDILKRHPCLKAFRSSVNWIKELKLKDSSLKPFIRHLIIDKALVIQILRSAHSVFYNPSGIPVNNLSQAVRILGIENVKKLVLSSPILSLHEEKNRFLIQEWKISYLTAYIAREAAKEKRLDPEEVFLGALFRRIGREIMILNCPYLYKEILHKPKNAQKETFALIAEKMLCYWNLPMAFLEGLEGPLTDSDPTILGKVILVSESLAQEILEKKPLSGWNQLFDFPTLVYQALDKLEKDLEIFPVNLATHFREILAGEISIQEGPIKIEKIIFSDSSIKFLKKILCVLEEEMDGYGLLMIQKNGKLHIEMQNPKIKDLTPKQLKDTLGSEIKEVKLNTQKALVIPFEIGETPAGSLLIFKDTPFSSEEKIGVWFIKKTIDSLLKHL